MRMSGVWVCRYSVSCWGVNCAYFGSTGPKGHGLYTSHAFFGHFCNFLDFNSPFLFIRSYPKATLLWNFYSVPLSTERSLKLAKDCSTAIYFIQRSL